MPGVAVLPGSPGLGGFGGPQPGPSECLVTSKSCARVDGVIAAFAGSGPSSTIPGSGAPNGKASDNMTVSEIKSKAKEHVQNTGKGASPMSLLKAARTQSQNAKDHEVRGDLKSALSSLIKTASLMMMALDSNEFRQDKHGGPLRKEWEDLLAVRQLISWPDMRSNMNSAERLRRPISTNQGS